MRPDQDLNPPLLPPYRRSEALVQDHYQHQHLLHSRLHTSFQPCDPLGVHANERLLEQSQPTLDRNPQVPLHQRGREASQRRCTQRPSRSDSLRAAHGALLGSADIEALQTCSLRRLRVGPVVSNHPSRTVGNHI